MSYSHFTVPRETVLLAEAAVVLIEARQGFRTTPPKALATAFRAFAQQVKPSQVAWLTAATLPTPDGEKGKLSVPKVVGVEVREYAKKCRCRPATLWHYAMYTVVTSMVNTSARKKDLDEQWRAVWNLCQRANGGLKVSKELLRQEQKEDDDMKYYPYVEEFRRFVSRYTGGEEVFGRMMKVHVHVMPLPYTDAPKRNDSAPTVDVDLNPYTVHTVRIDARGRGYSVNVFDVGETVPAQGLHPKTGGVLEPPVLPVGSSYRLADIWPNIDWATIQLL